MGYVMVAAFLGFCVLMAWVLIGCVCGLIVRLAKPKGVALGALFVVFVFVAAIPPLCAKAWFDGFAEEENRLSMEREAKEWD